MAIIGRRKWDNVENMTYLSKEHVSAKMSTLNTDLPVFQQYRFVLKRKFKGTERYHVYLMNGVSCGQTTVNRSEVIL